jgi:hypothetical protein
MFVRSLITAFLLVLQLFVCNMHMDVMMHYAYLGLQNKEIILKCSHC